MGSTIITKIDNSIQQCLIDPNQWKETRMKEYFRQFWPQSVFFSCRHRCSLIMEAGFPTICSASFNVASTR